MSEKGGRIRRKKTHLIDTDNSMVITREKEKWAEVEEDKVGTNGDGTGLDLGW